MFNKKKYLNMGGSLVSKNIIKGKGKLYWCSRGQPCNEVDNGWRFFSEIDTDEFLSSPRNMMVLSWEQVVEIEPAVADIFDFPFGTEFALIEEDGEKHFYDSDSGYMVSGIMVSKNILEGKGNLRWCCRIEPCNDVDSGWRFYSDIDTDQFLNSSENVQILSWEQMVEIEPVIECIFELPVGTELSFIEKDGIKNFYDASTGLKII